MTLKLKSLCSQRHPKGLFNVGTADLSFSSANKVRIMNMVGVMTTVISALYSLLFLFVLNNTLVAFINFVFTSAYALTLFFNYFKANRGSKIWFFSILMLHLLVCTNVYVTNNSGFHLYYFLVPTGVFLLFELREKKEKIILSGLSVIFYFYCENTLNASPLIEVSAQMNHQIYQSVILVIMVEVIVVLTVFAREIERHETMLTRQAQTDALTGVSNRHSFFEQGQFLLDASKLHNLPFSIILIDFDNFKRVNDEYGHHVGDVCLAEIATVLSSESRSRDIVARIGGEEFSIVLPETAQQEAGEIAERIRVKLEQHPIPMDKGGHLNCTASFGVCGKNSNSDSLKSILVEADNALYQAKEKGRNRVQLWRNIPAV